MKVRPIAAGLLLFISAFTATAWGQATPLGSEFQVNSFTTGKQIKPGVCSDASGNFVAVWLSDVQDAVMGRRSFLGLTIGPEFMIGMMPGNSPPRVSCDAAGNFVVVWEGSSDILAQRYDSIGVPLGSEFRVNTETSGSRQNPAAASDSSGNFVVVWDGKGSGDSQGVFAQRYDSTGAALGTEFRVNTTTAASQERPAVSCDAAGDCVVVWDGKGGADRFGIFAQRYDSTGAAVGTEFQVNSFSDSGQRNAGVCSDAAGDFVVVWQSGGDQDGDGSGVFGQRYDSTGAAAGPEFQVNSYTRNHQLSPAVACDTSGNFVVVWSSKNEDGSGDGIFSRRYDSTGTAVGNEFRVNSHVRQDQNRPAVSFGHSGAGDFVVLWNSHAQDGDSSGVFGQVGFFITPSSLPCPILPLGGCRTALKSSFDLKDNSDDGKDLLSWRWSRGQATALIDYGDPLGGATRYALCVYDASSNLEMSVEIPDGTPMAGTGVWTTKSTSYGYKDKAGLPDGVSRASLRASVPSVDNAKIRVSGRGMNIDLPGGGVMLVPPVTVQLINSTNGNCFEATYSGGQIIRNRTNRFVSRF
jgi:hypothetical protein